jgi:hypothetical protein
VQIKNLLRRSLHRFVWRKEDSADDGADYGERRSD